MAAIRASNPETQIEVLTADFFGVGSAVRPTPTHSLMPDQLVTTT